MFDERNALSSGHFSHDDQIADVLSYLSGVEAFKATMDRFCEEFPEYNDLVWSGSWVDWEASGVDVEYMLWVCDWIESNTPVYWEDGEPWVSPYAHPLDCLFCEAGEPSIHNYEPRN